MVENDLNQPKKSKKKLLACLLILLTMLFTGLCVGYFILNNDSKNPVVAEVAGEKVYLTDYNEMLFTATRKGTPESPVSNPSLKELILNQAVNLKIIDKELTAKGITLSEEEIITEAKKIYPSYDAASELIKLAYRDFARLGLGSKKLSEKVLTWKEGFSLFCRFDRADQDDMVGKPKEARAFKVKQRKYAQKYCQGAKDRLENKSASYEEELARVKADATIGESVWKPYSMAFGVMFNKDRFSPENFSFVYDEYEQISKIKPEKKDNFYTLTIKDMLSKDKGNAFFAVVYLKGVGNEGEAIDMETWFKEKRSQYNVKTYIERIKE